MNDLIKLRQQIAEMEQQARELQKQNRPAVLAQIREQMAAYGITAEELGRPPARAAKVRAAPAQPAGPAKGKKAPKPSAPKYRGPEAQAWSGRGPAPKWLKEQLAQGQALEDFLVAQAGAEAPGSAAAE